ncbi:methionine synthase [Nocardioides gansuensis]|uniref:Methionine synthase n=1 Tax=Nocardioides gansuensis TaxID=2138300 RepID=A0A2T8F6P7_9ACTN|nr:methionine synthase [Nocardioides gansuensis]PVG81383.1 methionine synthase [Nocardioides gansuensis]
MSLSTGIGSFPGDDDRAYAEAVRVVLGELPDLPHVPELPGRGAIATMTGRALAVVDGVTADLQPAGWRLTDTSGIDHRRARSLLAQDLDQVEEQAQEHRGAFKTQVAGPWTLAATVEKPRGDKVLSDHGARRELAQALAEGVRGHVADLRRRLPGVDRLVVQVDEPALAAVLDGKVPTASGFGRHRTVDLPEASAALEWVLAAITESGAEPWVHSCAPRSRWSLVRGAGAVGLSADLAVLDAGDLDAFAAAVEDGGTIALGLVPTSEADLTDAVLVERVLRWLDMLGLDPAEVGERLVVTPTCGLAGASAVWARRALELSREAALRLG